MDAGSVNQSLLLRMMDATSMRRDVLLANLANTETPGFQRKVVRFEDLLQDAVKLGRDPASVEPVVEIDLKAPAGDDGNTVNMELELGELRENRLMYETYAAILGAQFELMRASIESGR
jgi:flagellar basal-body rod protein FlgB